MNQSRRYVIDASVRRVGSGTVLVGGSPLKLFRLTGAGAGLLDNIESGQAIEMSPPVSRLLDRLVDAGVLHPTFDGTITSDASTAGTVTVVIPAYNTSTDAQRRLVQQCRAHGGAAIDAVLIVDDASTTPIADVDGATVVRASVNGGPGVARAIGLALAKTPLVAFVDTDMELGPDWLAPLLDHFADTRVALVAPRVASAPGSSLLARYEVARSPLDLGDEPARVRAGTRVSYVPAALMVCRVDALRAVDGFDSAMRVGEDVDLVWRLDQAGWQIRFEPAVTVRHQPRTSWIQWTRQRCSYGTSAAPLAQRHQGALAPVRVSAWSVASWLAVAAGWPVVGGAVAAVTTALLARKLRTIPDGGREAIRLAALGHIFAGRSLATGLSRAWWPLTLMAAVLSKRARRVALVAFTAPAAIDWLTKRPPIDPVRYVAIRALDDIAYGAGLWQGCIAARSLDALRPDLTSWPHAAARVNPSRHAPHYRVEVTDS